jgi:hypothetical protein
MNGIVDHLSRYVIIDIPIDAWYRCGIPSGCHNPALGKFIPEPGILGNKYEVFISEVKKSCHLICLCIKEPIKILRQLKKPCMRQRVLLKNKSKRYNLQDDKNNLETKPD